MSHVKFTLTIDSGNVGITDSPAWTVSELLAEVAGKVRDYATAGYLRDYNGHTVGEWSLNVTDRTCARCHEVITDPENAPDDDNALCKDCGDTE